MDLLVGSGLAAAVVVVIVVARRRRLHRGRRLRVTIVVEHSHDDEMS